MVSPLAEGLPFLYIKKFMLKTIPTNITQEGRHPLATFLDVREFIPEKSPTYVMNVVIPLSLVHPFVIIREFTQERNLLNVVSVGEPSVRVHLLFNMKEFTLEKSLTDVMNVKKVSLLFHDLIDTE